MKSRAWTSGLLASLAPCLVLACSSSSSPPVTVEDSGADGSHPKTDAGDGGTTKHDAASDAGPDTTAPKGDAGSDTSTGTDAPVMDAPFDASGFVPVDGGAAVITEATPEVWTWIPFPESKCRDGSTTGIGVNFNPASTKLMIYLEGGGACFNSLTCAENPSSFGAADLPTRFPSATDGGAPEDGNGILDRDNAANPVADWNFIYVPYCTGDIHAGNNPAGVIPGLAPQFFVGYENVDLYLQRIVPTFSTATQVLLTGVSGGGFGAAANYIHVARAFGSIPVDLIDDSGPAMEDPYLAACLQNENRAIWNLDSTIGADCAGHCNDPASFFLDYAKYAATLYPNQTLGLMDSTDDGTITQYFGFGADDCKAEIPVALTAAAFTAGLDDIRTKLAAETNVGSFYFTGTDHTSLGDDNFYSRTAGTTQLTTWVQNLITGTASNAGP
jgi:hypothetical protein